MASFGVVSKTNPREKERYIIKVKKRMNKKKKKNGFFFFTYCKEVKGMKKVKGMREVKEEVEEKPRKRKRKREKERKRNSGGRSEEGGLEKDLKDQLQGMGVEEMESGKQNGKVRGKMRQTKHCGVVWEKDVNGDDEGAQGRE